MGARAGCGDGVWGAGAALGGRAAAASATAAAGGKPASSPTFGDGGAPNQPLPPAALPTAQVGSIFEYANQRPVFDVIQPDSPLYAPILGFFALTGLPTAGFLFYK